MGGDLVTVTAEGEVIGKIPANSMSLGKTFNLTVNNKGEQVPDKFVEEPAVSLIQTVNGTPGPAFINWGSTISFEEKMEINTVA